MLVSLAADWQGLMPSALDTISIADRVSAMIIARRTILAAPDRFTFLIFRDATLRQDVSHHDNNIPHLSQLYWLPSAPKRAIFDIRHYRR